MLYDPKWDKEIETKADPYKLESLIAWLETQNPATTYNYHNLRGDCLLCQYLTASGVDYIKYGELLTANQRNRIAAARPWTFGNALERARAELIEAWRRA